MVSLMGTDKERGLDMRKTEEYSSKRRRNDVQERSWLGREYLQIVLAPSLQN